PSGDGLEGHVSGDEVDADRKITARGRDILALMQGGLGDYLQEQAYVLRLFRLTEEAKNGTLPAALTAGSEKPAYKSGDTNFAFLVQSDRPGLLYILDQDSDGIVQMVWPNPLFPANHLAAGRPERWPGADDARALQVSAPPPRTLNRAV